MVTEIAGEKFVYRDLIDLQMKLTKWVDTLREEREHHEQEAVRIRKQEKIATAFLGQHRAGREERGLEKAHATA